MAAFTSFRDSLSTMSCARDRIELNSHALKSNGAVICEVQNTGDDTATILFVRLHQPFVCPQPQLTDAILYLNARGVMVTQGLPCKVTGTFALTLGLMTAQAPAQGAA